MQQITETIQNAVFRILGNLLSPAGKKGQLIILTYHRVLEKADPLLKGEVDAVTFDWQLGILSRYFNVLPLSEAAERLSNGSLPARALCITFDDGYANNYEVALPILKKWGLQATFFIAAGFLAGGRMWNDAVIDAVRMSTGNVLNLKAIGLDSYLITNMEQRSFALNQILNILKYLPQDERQLKVDKMVEIVGQKLPDNLMMNHEQLRSLHASGMEIGGHTVTHPILSTLPDSKAIEEISNGRNMLREITGAEINTFAYPNGQPMQDYNRIHVEAVRDAGYQVAVSTAQGCAKEGCDLLQLPRLDFWDKSTSRFILRMMKNYLAGQAPTV